MACFRPGADGCATTGLWPAEGPPGEGGRAWGLMQFEQTPEMETYFLEKKGLTVLHVDRCRVAEANLPFKSKDIGNDAVGGSLKCAFSSWSWGLHCLPSTFKFLCCIPKYKLLLCQGYNPTP